MSGTGFNSSSGSTTKDGIVAYPTGGQANATILVDDFNIVDTVASPLDSCKCNPAVADKVKTVYNSSANNMNLYPAIGERFKDGSTLMAINDPIIIGSGNGIQLVCYTNGIWRFN